MFFELSEEDKKCLSDKIKTFSDVKIVLENLLKESENVSDIIEIYKFCLKSLNKNYAEIPVSLLEVRNDRNIIG
jgi:hypothetical protein